MNDDLLKISLNQGKQFNTYQKKIKKNITKTDKTNKRSNKKEGFVTFRSLQEQEQMVRPSFDGYSPVLKNMQQTTSLTNNANQRDLDELKQLQLRYNTLIQQYTDIQKKIGDSSLNTINRLGSNNPYLNKTIRFTTGHICYVTNQGVVKYIPSPEIWDSVNAPKNYIDINIPWDNSYSKEGTIIPTNPQLISGSFMEYGQSLGNEGLNVYVNSILQNDIKPTYMGCYATSPNNDNMTFIGNKPEKITVSLQNGNFEQPVIGNNTYKYINDHNTVPGWGFTAVLLNNSSAWGYPMPYPRGNQCCSIQSTSNIRQNIYLYVNYTYTLTFYSCGRNCCTNPNTGNPVSIDLYDQNMNLIQHIYDFTPPVNAWTNYSVNFNVSSNQKYRLYFSGKTSDSDKSSAIQGISIGVGSISIGDYTYEQCKDAAIENGYQYFALQNVNTTTSKGFCAVSNSEPSITQYGESKVASKQVPLWSSNTGGQPGNSVILSTIGSLNVINSSGGAIYSSPGSPNALPSNYLGCYGDNSNRAMGLYNNGNHQYNLAQCQDIANKNGYKYFGLQDSTSGITAQCALSNDLNQAIKYGKATNCTKISDGSWSGGGWSNAVYNSNVPESNYYLILQDDGNMCIYRGTSPNDNQGGIWCSQTNGKQLKANPNMAAEKGKYGKNWISSGQTLSAGDFIGSNDGKLALIMQADGNLVLYTFDMDENCLKINNGLMGGGEGANSVYNIGKIGIPKNLGLLGYIDSDSNLKEYPDSMVGFTNDYQIYPNTDSYGNDIGSLVVSDQNGCQTACNNNPDCAAYVYQDFSKTCWIKNKSAFPKGEKQPNSSLVLGVRKPGLKGTTTCSNKVSNIDTIQFENYLKGSDMTPDTQCNLSIVSQEDQIQFDNIKSQLITVGNDIVAKMESLYNQDKTIFQKLNTNAEQFKKDLENYKLTNLKIKKELDLQNLPSNNIEGMQNFTSLRNMNDINGMLSDSDLRVLQGNYSYIMWSILAVGILTVTINTMKK